VSEHDREITTMGGEGGEEQDRFCLYVLSIIQLYGILFLLADVSFMPVAVFMMACCLSKSWVCEVHRTFFYLH